ncbi:MULTISPECIES: non-hydrolyzing UDP-N-acetylglucosamine 2-epimerase [Tenacibaculum]|uniref:non-hydrolyzing UDP-N-acetylglucosamine 2-epimerase n=1 Tax=Tenacibaculum TaxID=104267 RepID=UPI001F0A6E4A|nr:MULTISPECIES: UDP-N-acetylglucosamine 2-epimerase (non-hydrolyzing) [Tenacibaculum]MCH3883133.1 UDP-N-acetylglucosamine 2-epimerase (non-hydrolyzing) [Tenacibaculum aquimarinum]MDO6600871.1 UDP-N-acetylglucosamine 2-epimerase (non-hydrolyzing) [Tenacibaculum sp. 1_MG-2023]
MKIITIIGARPQFVKAAALSREIAKFNNVEEIIIHTGQHFDENMSDIFFEQMHIPKPNYNLGIDSLGHGAMTGRMIEGIEKITLEEKPDWILVYGDTNSTLAGAIVASKLHIKLAHVEAGLRSYNMEMPEEVNRILTDRISNILFCPTETAVNNLSKEGFDNFSCEIKNVGDVMYDAALFYKNKAQKPDFNLPDEFILSTIHRAENTNSKEKLSLIIESFNKINKETPVVLTLHPRTKSYIEKYNLKPEFTLIDPVGYLEMVYMLNNCKLVMTDSGGLQKEAYFFEKPCVTLRDQTEWVELVKHGANELTNISINEIFTAYENSLNKEIDFSKELYGNGKSSNKIIEALLVK